MAIDLKGKVAVVTGSGRGIGKAVATRFLEAGAKVVINDVDEAPAQETFQAFKETGREVALCVADVGKREDADRIIQTAMDTWGKIDILVNVAGVWRDAMVHKMTDEQFDFVLKVNLYGTFYCTRAAYVHMKEQGSGAIVNFTSQAGIGGNIGQANYSAAKSGVIGLTKSNAKEFGRYNVRVNCISPNAQGTRAIEGLPDKFVEEFRNQVPLRRFGEPQEIANAVAFLVSDDASIITGQIVGADGGFNIGKP